MALKIRSYYQFLCNIYKFNCIVNRKFSKAAAVPINDIRGMDLKEIVTALESYASSSLAESWDNVGLLVKPSAPHRVQKLFLTNDLTEEVLDEAVAKKADLILSYHPPIFSSIKRITQVNWKNRILVKAIENRIGIYSPHTSYDALKGGVNDWLVSCFEGDVSPITPAADGSENGIGRICRSINPLKVTEVT